MQSSPLTQPLVFSKEERDVTSDETTEQVCLVGPGGQSGFGVSPSDWAKANAPNATQAPSFISRF
jgi:hypothetical protein